MQDANTQLLAQEAEKFTVSNADSGLRIYKQMTRNANERRRKRIAEQVEIGAEQAVTQDGRVSSEGA